MRLISARRDCINVYRYDIRIGAREIRSRGRDRSRILDRRVIERRLLLGIILMMAFEFTLVNVSVNGDDERLPSFESSRAVNYIYKTVLDCRLETLHKRYNFCLFYHVKMTSKFYK